MLPSKIAEQVAHAPASKTILIDAFAGAGGNVIAFALSGRWKQIFAVEKDPKTLACAKHNAEVYGVAKKIWWIEGDVFDVLKNRLKASGKNAVIFASPPWGGEFPFSVLLRALRLICSRTIIHRLGCVRPLLHGAVQFTASLRCILQGHK
jgi:tRNA G37 N-methylase Trm5